MRRGLSHRRAMKMELHSPVVFPFKGLVILLGKEFGLL